MFSDEIYSQIIYDDEFNSIASIKNMQERTVILDGLSKTYSMPGWRLGFITNMKLAKHISTWVLNNTSCAAHMTQWACVEALNGKQDEAKKMVKEFKERRDIIVDGLNSIKGFSCLKPGGAFYAWPNVTEACKITGVKDSEEFRIKLLDEAKVAVLADPHFGALNKNEGFHVRFSYARSKKEIKEGIVRVKKYMDGF